MKWCSSDGDTIRIQTAKQEIKLDQCNLRNSKIQAKIGSAEKNAKPFSSGFFSSRKSFIERQVSSSGVSNLTENSGFWRQIRKIEEKINLKKVGKNKSQFIKSKLNSAIMKYPLFLPKVFNFWVN